MTRLPVRGRLHLGVWRRAFEMVVLCTLITAGLEASTDEFFPRGVDRLVYDPRASGTSRGKLIVSDASGIYKCRFEYVLSAGKTVSKVEMGYISTRVTGIREFLPVVFVTDGSGSLSYHRFREFTLICPDDPPKVSHLAVTEPEQVRVSNDADSFDVTCDGTYAIVVGSSSPTPARPVSTPVSLVDLRTKVEVDKFAVNATGTFVAACDDGQSVLVLLQIFLSQFDTTPAIRRFTVTDGKLTDTGEVFTLNNPDDSIFKVFAVAGSKVGLALTQVQGIGAQLISFGIPGLKVVDSVRIQSSGEVSAAVSCNGDKVYVRNGNVIQGFALDPVIGELGDLPFLTIPDVSIAHLFDFYGNALSISRDGTQLVVSEPAESPSDMFPSKVNYYDALTGSRLGNAEIGALVNPTLVDTLSCCLPSPFALEAQLSSAGLVQITAFGEVGERYELQKSENLVTWQKVGDFQMTAAPANYTDLESKTNSSRFYRVRLVP